MSDSHIGDSPERDIQFHFGNHCRTFTNLQLTVGQSVFYNIDVHKTWVTRCPPLTITFSNIDIYKPRCLPLTIQTLIVRQ